MKNLEKLEKIIDIKFKDKNFLKTAMIHRSYINEHRSFKLGHNERLEFLGDAVLELVVTEHLFDNFENPEGELTNWRASLVNAKMLAEVAKELNLEPFISMSRGEAQDKNSKARNYILANAMEALIGAIYLDQGYEISKKFIEKSILVHLDYILKNNLYMDPKSLFQEKAQEMEGITPSYKVLEESGPDHAKFFKVGLYLKKEMIAEGTGTSKQEAQIAAAKNGLSEKDWDK